MRARIMLIQFAQLTRNVYMASISGYARYMQLLNYAISKYKHAGQVHMHHVVPQYIVKHFANAGVKIPQFVANWTVPLNPRYHQLITNAIRAEYGFGSAVFKNHPASVSRLIGVLVRVYSQFPLPMLKMP